MNMFTKNLALSLSLLGALGAYAPFTLTAGDSPKKTRTYAQKMSRPEEVAPETWIQLIEEYNETTMSEYDKEEVHETCERMAKERPKIETYLGDYLREYRLKRIIINNIGPEFVARTALQQIAKPNKFETNFSGLQSPEFEKKSTAPEEQPDSNVEQLIRKLLFEAKFLDYQEIPIVISHDPMNIPVMASVSIPGSNKLCISPSLHCDLYELCLRKNKSNDKFKAEMIYAKTLVRQEVCRLTRNDDLREMIFSCWGWLFDDSAKAWFLRRINLESIIFNLNGLSINRLAIESSSIISDASRQFSHKECDYPSLKETVKSLKKIIMDTFINKTTNTQDPTYEETKDQKKFRNMLEKLIRYKKNSYLNDAIYLAKQQAKKEKTNGLYNDIRSKL
ncbi:hypothetical protein HOL34_01115 [bacterium]|jgi:hypothetical protein|nr:hypothetical protein [bacterium]MBT3903735.1 hypothetical protein [bacterium]MBT4577892.1 hypothetical protein [bacterium]MBT5345687.1 hypothetical protein [bacterium]MBT6131272.1 hypothetical protein [bacterium]